MGVRHGVILSPVVLSICMDDLSIPLAKSKLGYHITDFNSIHV